MSLKPGKRDIARVAARLEEPHDSAESAAQAAIEEAWEIYEAKAKYAVVGQLRYSGEVLSPDDARAARVIVGPFGTLKQAQGAGNSLALSSATGEEARWWAVPMWHGTPAAWYAERKKAAREAEALTSGMHPREIRLQMRERFFADNPGASTLPEHLQGSGWDSLDEFQVWLEEHADQCRSCGGTGRINNDEKEN